VHVHSTFSTGEESIEHIAGLAVAHGLDVLIMTDDDLLKVDYGIPFLRRLVRFSHVENSLVTAGTLKNYLEEIRRVDALYPGLILIDGIESAPFYYWGVDLGQRRWILRHWNKHLMAIDLRTPEAYARLPVIASEALEVWHWSSLLLLWPLLGLIYAWVGRHPRALRWPVAVISVLCLVNNFPFKVPLWDAYSGDLGPAPYQYYIDYVIDHGGLVFWTHPESKSTIKPIDVFGGQARIFSVTPPHAEDLVHTYGYTGFAALYGDNITATEPGRQWDQILQEYLRGERQRPIWGDGEIDYHYDDVKRRNQIHDILTVFLVQERTREAVLEAMRHGRMYAARGGDEMLLLSSFRVDTELERAVAGEEVASQGDAEVHIRIDKASGGEEQTRVRLIKSGEVVAQVSGVTPLEFKHIDTSIQPGEKVYYRLLAYSRTARLTSNPIFVTGVKP